MAALNTKARLGLVALLHRWGIQRRVSHLPTAISRAFDPVKQAAFIQNVKTC